MLRSCTMVGLASLLLTLGIGVFASSAQQGEARKVSPAEGLAAWEQVHSVLVHPRCINCHTATNYPQIGDDRRRHPFNVVRGPDGRGVPGLACGTCHQGATS